MRLGFLCNPVAAVFGCLRMPSISGEKKGGDKHAQTYGMEDSSCFQ
jgi:hypothetical protein